MNESQCVITIISTTTTIAITLNNSIIKIKDCMRAWDYCKNKSTEKGERTRTREKLYKFHGF